MEILRYPNVRLNTGRGLWGKRPLLITLSPRYTLTLLLQVRRGSPEAIAPRATRLPRQTARPWTQSLSPPPFNPTPGATRPELRYLSVTRSSAGNTPGRAAGPIASSPPWSIDRSLLLLLLADKLPSVLWMSEAWRHASRQVSSPTTPVDGTSRDDGAFRSSKQLTQYLFSGAT